MELAAPTRTASARFPVRRSDGEVEIIISNLTDDIPRLKLAAVFTRGSSVEKAHLSADINTIPSSQLHGVVEWIFAVGDRRRSDAPRLLRAKSGKETHRRLPTERRKGETLLISEREWLKRKKSAVQRSAIERDLSRHLRLHCRQRKATTKKSRHGSERALVHGENSQPKIRERQQNFDRGERSGLNKEVRNAGEYFSIQLIPNPSSCPPRPLC